MSTSDLPSPNSLRLPQHRGSQLYTKALLPKLTTTTPNRTLHTKGKSPYPYLHVVLVNSVDRKLNNKPILQHNNSKTNKSDNPTLQSPYTRVYGKRKIYDTTLASNNLKQNSTTSNTISSIKGINRGTKKLSITSSIHIHTKVRIHFKTIASNSTTQRKANSFN